MQERLKKHFYFKNYDRHQWEALFWLFMIPLLFSGSKNPSSGSL